ncbi:hypothetical protein LJC00_00300 [Dysgonomonas sp. OttesenSCG-928-M03]|nr:hypothetical protein [Dysgonomonas sp. OttesenSCG-928-M03]
MISKKEEQEFYCIVYFLTFGRESLYFYQNDSSSIFDFLKSEFWGEDLRLKTELLSKLLYFDSLINPSISTELRIKSKELLEYINHIQE